jgi:hypothetical protein
MAFLWQANVECPPELGQPVLEFSGVTLMPAGARRSGTALSTDAGGKFYDHLYRWLKCLMVKGINAFEGAEVDEGWTVR